MAENKDCDCLTQESQIDSIMEDETQLDANLEEDGELGSELENVVEVSKVYTGGETKDAIVHVNNDKNAITTTLQKMWFSSFQEFPAVGSDNLIYADKGTGVLYTYNSETNSYDELISEPQITIDTEMSDTSENAVQNKVIKSYVDTEVNTINGEIDSLGNTVADVENKINGINTSITTINGNISTIDGEIGQINADITGIKGDLDGKAGLGDDNVFSGKQTFNGEVEVNSGASFNRDVTLTDASLKVLDNTTDTATTYKSTSIDIENNGGTKTTLTLPKKNGTILTDSDINLKHSKIQNADTVNEEIDEIRIIDPEARFKIASQVENNQTELNVERNYIAMKHAGTSGSAEVSLSSNDAVIQSTDLNGNVTNVTVTPTSAQLNGKDIVTTKGAEFEQRPTVKDNGTAVDVVLKSDLENYVPSQSENGTHYSQVNNQDGQFSVHISKNGETADLHNLIINKDGVFITGKVKLQGDADISGIVTVKETETLKVKDNIVITNADGVDLVDMSGLGIRKNSSDTYGIVYDPASDSVKLGLGKLDNSGKFAFNEGEGQPVAVRDDSSLLVDGHLVKWDATNHKFVDCGKDVSDSTTANSIASRTADGALKATSISDIDIENQTDNTVATKKDLKSVQDKIPTALSSLTEDATHRTVSDTEKATWNGKQNALTAGSNITITDNTISAKDTTYTAGENITISDDNVISASGGTPIDVVQETGTSTTAVMSQDAATKELNTKLKTNTFNLYVGTTDACSNANGDFGQCSQIYNNDGTFYADRKFLFNKNDFAQEGQDAEKKYSLANDVVRTKDLANKQDKLTNSEFQSEETFDSWKSTKETGGLGLLSQDGKSSLVITNDIVTVTGDNGQAGFQADKQTHTAIVFGTSAKLTGGSSTLEVTNNSLKFDNTNVLTESSIVQSTGTATDKVISQKATTDELNKKFDKTGGNISGEVSIKDTNGTMISHLNNDETTDYAVSYKNNAFEFGNMGKNLRLLGNTTRPKYETSTTEEGGVDLALLSDIPNVPSVSQSTGTSTTAVMSQKAVTDELKKNAYYLEITIENYKNVQLGNITTEQYTELMSSSRPLLKLTETTNNLEIFLLHTITGFEQVNFTNGHYSLSFTHSEEKVYWRYSYYDEKQDTIDTIYPVGSIYLSVNKKSPASFIGGTWEELPANNTLWTTATSSANAGTTIAAGLPNITAAYNYILSRNDTYSASGAGTANKNDTTTRQYKLGESYTFNLSSQLSFDASKSNSIYGSSTTVQPPAYRIYAWKRKA